MSFLLPEYLRIALLRASHIWDVIYSCSVIDRTQSMETSRNSPEVFKLAFIVGVVIVLFYCHLLLISYCAQFYKSHGSTGVYI